MTYSKRLFIGAGVAILLAGASYLLGWSTVFSVKNITVVGAPSSVSQSEILVASGVSVGEKMARVDPNAIELRLKKFAWINNTDVVRDWLNGKIQLIITPRTPVALYEGGQLDINGAIFSLPNFSLATLPLVAGSTPTLGLSAIELFRALPIEFRKSVVLLRAASENNFVVTFNWGDRVVTVLWGDNSESALKVRVFQALLTLPENAKVTQVDLTAPHAPLVK